MSIQTAGKLSPREREVLGLLAIGMTDREIAAALGISARTVGGHAQRIYRRTGGRGRVDAAVYAVRHGLINVEEGTNG